jgi:hypothetical protein
MTMHGWSDTESGEERNHEDSEGASEWTNAKPGIVGDQHAALEQGWNISQGRRVLVHVVPGGTAMPQRLTIGETQGESGGNKRPPPPSPFADLLASEMEGIPEPPVKRRSPTGAFPSKNTSARARRDLEASTRAGPLKESRQKCWDSHGQPPPGSTAPGFLENFFPSPRPDELHQDFPDNHPDSADYCSGLDSDGSERATWTYYDALNHVDHLRLAAEEDPSSAQLQLQWRRAVGALPHHPDTEPDETPPEPSLLPHSPSSTSLDETTENMLRNHGGYVLSPSEAANRTPNPRVVAVVGGGPAGFTFAIKIAERALESLEQIAPLQIRVDVCDTNSTYLGTQPSVMTDGVTTKGTAVTSEQRSRSSVADYNDCKSKVLQRSRRDRRKAADRLSIDRNSGRKGAARSKPVSSRVSPPTRKTTCTSLERQQIAEMLEATATDIERKAAHPAESTSLAECLRQPRPRGDSRQTPPAHVHDGSTLKRQVDSDDARRWKLARRCMPSVVEANKAMQPFLQEDEDLPQDPHAGAINISL